MKFLQIGVALLLLYAALVGLTWLFQRRLIYLPLGQRVPPVGQVLPGAREVALSTRDGLRLAAWWLPAGGGRGAVIVCNGNAGNRSDRADLARAFHALELSVLLLDYRGYGGNPGAPSEAGLIEDARAARRFVDRESAGAPAPVFYFGESLGAAVAVALAREHPPTALILRSPFASMAEVGRLHYPFLPVGYLLKDRYPSRQWIRSLSCPLLVLAGDRDSIVPVEQSRALFAAAPMADKQFVLLAGVDHNDAEFYGGARMLRPIAEFLRPWRQ